MRTIRRLYVYLVSFISLEVVIWGLIGLVRSMVGGELIGRNASQLASALSLIAVGIPVFLLHWWLAQGNIGDHEERFARLRTIFLYGALLVTLIPISQNVLALVNHIWLQIFNLPAQMAFIGEGQTWLDNIIAVVMNGLIAAYINSVLRKDWEVTPQGSTLPETRRLYRYVWVVYGLAMVVGGIQQVLFFILNIGSAIIGKGQGVSLANGLALLITGTPVWIYAWRTVQQSLSDLEEGQSTLRLVILYALSLIGVGGVLIPAGLGLDVIFRFILGENMKLGGVLTEISAPLSAAIPFGGVWAYYGHLLTTEVTALPDTPRRTGLRRLYYYILAFVGLITTLLGLNTLLTFIIDMLLQTSTWVGSLRPRLAIALATLTIGLPLWVITWRPMVAEACLDGERGDHARRSLVRKVYLYLALFVGVIGVMVSAGSLIYQLLSKLLGTPPDNYQRTSWMLVELVVLFVALLSYHWATLRKDGRLAEQYLAARHEAFPVLVLAPEIGGFSEEMLNCLHQEVPSLPVAVHIVSNGIPDETLSAAKAVILPGELSANPTEAIRLWLQRFDGTRLVVPSSTENWLWAYGSGRSLANLAHQTAVMIRYLAEGEEIPKTRETSPWMVVLYILAGIVGIPILIGLFTSLSNILN
jgi:hypothetical protein